MVLLITQAYIAEVAVVVMATAVAAFDDSRSSVSSSILLLQGCSSPASAENATDQ